MSGTVSIQVTNNKLARANTALRRILSETPQAVARTINRTVEGLKTDAARETSRRYFVKATDVRASMSPKKASSGNLQGAMVSKDKRHLLDYYKLTPTSPNPGGKTEIKGAVKTAGGLKTLKSAFLVRRAGGTYFPFVRVGSGAGSSNQYRYKGIRSLIAPALPQIIKNRDTVKAMRMGAEERFIKRLDHEILRLFGALP